MYIEGSRAGGRRFLSETVVAAGSITVSDLSESLIRMDLGSIAQPRARDCSGKPGRRTPGEGCAHSRSCSFF
ncbi:MAG: hypothetical protein LBS04_04485 [Tannerellaceae bacterium]|nr:hypothetical protein [Tannerellaceae bacterium]